MVIKRNSQSRLRQAEATAKRLGVFRAREFVAAGFPREYLRRLLGARALQQLGRGLYAPVSFEGDSNRVLVEAAKRIPRGIVCLISALRFHDIGTQSPAELWLAIPRSTNFPRSRHLPLRFCKYSQESYTFGIQEHPLPGGAVRIYSPAKTVADCFKYRNKFGLDIAVEALRDGWRQKKFTMQELSAAAGVCRVQRVIQPYLEMLT